MVFSRGNVVVAVMVAVVVNSVGGQSGGDDNFSSKNDSHLVDVFFREI